MVVERRNNEILMRFSAGNNTSRIQSIFGLFKIRGTHLEIGSYPKRIGLALKKGQKEKVGQIQKSSGI